MAARLERVASTAGTAALDRAPRVALNAAQQSSSKLQRHTIELIALCAPYKRWDIGDNGDDAPRPPPPPLKVGPCRACVHWMSSVLVPPLCASRAANKQDRGKNARKSGATSHRPESGLLSSSCVGLSGDSGKPLPRDASARPTESLCPRAASKVLARCNCRYHVSLFEGYAPARVCGAIELLGCHHGSMVVRI